MINLSRPASKLRSGSGIATLSVAYRNGAVLARAGEGQQFGVRLRDLIGRGEIDANVEPLAGDVIVSPQSWI